MSNARFGQSPDSDGPAMKKRDEVMGAKVSVVIPVYNGANYLAEAIESALAQTHTNFEVVVVNDGSTDDGATRRVAQRYAGRIRYFEKPNGGVASALNFGIAEMTGEYFSWLSHDDLYLPDKIASQLDCLASSLSDRALIVYGNCAVFTGDSAKSQAVDVPDAGLKYFRYLLATSSAVHGCALLIPKSAFDNGGFDVSKPTTQDYDMWFRLAGAFDFVKLDKTLVLARQHPAQDSVKKRKKVRAEKNAIYCSFLAQLGPEDVNPLARRAPARAYMQLAMDYAKHGLVGATLVAAGKSMSCLKFRKGADALAAVMGLALVCTVAIPWGFARARVADFVRGAKTAA
jgi:glycosyltransferase involved in cell wall biosynthesis